MYKNSTKNYYEILNIDRNASDEEIRSSYKKLALMYHPDKNPNADASDKFKEISEAYSVLKDSDKRRQYDVMGDVDDNFGGEDPFNVFNEIFQQHINSFMNMKYDNNINVNSIFNNIPGFQNIGSNMPFGNVHVRVHTFPVDVMNNNNRINNNSNHEYDTDDDVEEIGIGEIFNKLFNGNKTKSNNNIEKEIFKKETIEKPRIIYNKPDDIVYDINVSLEDIYNFKKKKIVISRKRKVDGKYIDKKKKIEIPIYDKEILLYKQGDELKDYKEKGNIIINIFNKKDDKFKRINEYDILTTIDIELNKIYGSFCYEIILPNKEVLLVQSEKMNLNKILIQKINKKGLPHENTEGILLKGNLYIIYNIIYPLNIEELKDIKIYNDTTNIKDYFHIAYNCEMDEIFNDI
jgi:DnaJ-class molecular chaperone